MCYFVVYYFSGMEKFDLYVVTGNAGTGKPTLARRIAEPFGLQVLDPDLMRREMGIKHYDPSDTPRVMGEIFERIERSIRSRESAILATAYVRRRSREQSYQQLIEIGSDIGRQLNAVLIECICDEKTAKARISSRVSRDDLHSAGNDPAIYDKYVKMAEPITQDEILQNPDFSFMTYDSGINQVKRIAIREQHSHAFEILETQMRVEEKTHLETRTEKLARLHEAGEVIEKDSDLNDIFMFVRSNKVLTREHFSERFPKAQALVITQEQLWTIEALVDRDLSCCNNRFTYLTASGQKRSIEGDYLDEPFVLFLEDLGD